MVTLAIILVLCLLFGAARVFAFLLLAGGLLAYAVLMAALILVGR